MFRQHAFYDHVLAKLDKSLVRPRKYIAEQNIHERDSKNRPMTNPTNASIKEEYVKCKKYSCYTCPHVPYYYAYWKENGKLKKKYAGEADSESWKTGSKSDPLITAIQNNNDELLKAVQNRKPGELLDLLGKKRK